MEQALPKFQIKDLCIYSLNPANPKDISSRKACRILGIKPASEWKNPNIPEYIVLILNINEKRDVKEAELEEI